MKCLRCNRELKEHHESGMGDICQMKANRFQDSPEVKQSVTLVYDSRRGHRNYVVRNADGKAFVKVTEQGTDRIGKCFCPQGKSKVRCSHIDAVAVEDKQRFQAASVCS